MSFGPIKVTTPALTTTTTPPTPPELSDECLNVCPEAALYLPPQNSNSICPAQCTPITESNKACHAIREMATLEAPPKYSLCSIIGIKKYEKVSCIGSCDNCDQSTINLFTGKLTLNCESCKPTGISEQTMRLRCPDGTKVLCSRVLHCKWNKHKYYKYETKRRPSVTRSNHDDS